MQFKETSFAPREMSKTLRSGAEVCLSAVASPGVKQKRPPPKGKAKKKKKMYRFSNVYAARNQTGPAVDFNGIMSGSDNDNESEFDYYSGESEDEDEQSTDVGMDGFMSEQASDEGEDGGRGTGNGYDGMNLRSGDRRLRSSSSFSSSSKSSSTSTYANTYFHILMELASRAVPLCLRYHLILAPYHGA